MNTKERIEKAKNRVVKILHNIEGVIELFFKQNEKFKAENISLNLNNAQLHAKIADLQNVNANLCKELDFAKSQIGHGSVRSSNASRVCNVQSSTTTYSNDVNELCAKSDESMLAPSTSEYIDVSISQLKHFLKKESK